MKSSSSSMHVLEYLRDPNCARRPKDSLCAEYRLLCSGSIYRNGPWLEWYKSEGARFLLAPPLLLYAASRPFDEYPLELVLRLTVGQVEETSPGRGGMPNISFFHPDDEVARDLAALLTVLCRRLITVAARSAERLANYPYPEFDYVPMPLATSMRRVYWPPYPPKVIIGWETEKVEDNNPPPKPVDPGALTALLLGLPQLAHSESIVASARLYALALELIREQPDIAYQLLISSVEAIANETLRHFQPDDDEKVKHKQAVSNMAKKLGLEEQIARNLALTACKGEPWATRKFKKFLTDNMDDTVWDKEDDLFRFSLERERLPRRENFQQTLSKIYSARSQATHAGQRFPASASFSGGPTVPARVAWAFFGFGSDSVFPPVVWFERIVNTAIRTSWERSIRALSSPAPPAECATGPKPANRAPA
jgi:hypothetical protein